MATRDIEPAEPDEERASAPNRNEPSGIRPVARPRARSEHDGRRQVKILFVAANARAGAQLALDDEYRAIEQSLRAAKYRDAFQLIPRLAARLGDLQQALLEHSPDVVHFACHGSEQAELMLAAEEAETTRVTAGALASLFQVLRDNVRLVVFNACFASEQAAAVRRSAELAIGMRSQVEDRAAIAFASALYGALAYGRSVGEAFGLGRVAIEGVSPWARELPQLFAEDGIDADAVYLVRHPEQPRWPRIAAALAACAAIAPAWWLLRSEAGHREQQPPRLGMVRFSGRSIRPGVFAASRPGECAALTAEEDCAELEHPAKIAEVRLEPFDLDALEVTNRDFAAWLNTRAEAWQRIAYGILATRLTATLPLVRTSEECGGGLILAENGRLRAGADKASWPVVCVTWHGAREYCRAQGKRLPLEMEWEFAAKGTEGRPFPWGHAMPRHDGVTFDRLDSGAAHPSDVGTSPQDVSPEGVRDLGGNVAEWVEGSRGGEDRKTLRGGSWASRGPCHLLGSGCKHGAVETYGKDVGFRCASSVIAESPRGREGRR